MGVLQRGISDCTLSSTTDQAMRELNLSHNNIGDKGIKVLLLALEPSAQNGVLTDLELADCGITDAGGGMPVAASWSRMALLLNTNCIPRCGIASRVPQDPQVDCVRQFV